MTILLTLAVKFWKPLAGVLVVLAALTALAVYRQHLINQGWDDALVVVKKQNTVAADAAAKAQAGVDACYDRNGTWSTITGTCTEVGK